MPQSFFRSTELLFQFRTVSGFYFPNEKLLYRSGYKVIENYLR